MQHKFSILYFHFSLLILLGMSMISCEVNTSDNGPLDGLWQVTQIELQNGCSGKGMRTLPMYWAFQGNLMEIRQKTDGGGIFFRFANISKTLSLYEPVKNLRDSGDIKITDPIDLHQYGIYHMKENLRILHLSDESMILQSDSIQFTFRKY